MEFREPSEHGQTHRKRCNSIQLSDAKCDCHSYSGDRHSVVYLLMNTVCRQARGCNTGQFGFQLLPVKEPLVGVSDPQLA
ncbi:hypothetical protein J6590_081493 [Homalodisca vitripennis]|nr:hypothetical protein J6590_081493 [Homalodisca vitripennis]